MTVEPRASLAWSPWDAHTFSLAFGVHKQPEPFQFARAVHYVGGYTFRASDDLLFKAVPRDDRVVVIADKATIAGQAVELLVGQVRHDRLAHGGTVQIHALADPSGYAGRPWRL